MTEAAVFHGFEAAGEEMAGGEGSWPARAPKWSVSEKNLIENQ